MYLAIIVALMVVLPVLSVGAEVSLSHVPISMSLIAKWFVFWFVGVRLLLAGLRQITQPQYTARIILGLKSDESLVLVRELGFANVAMGLVGFCSVAIPGWRLAGALTGAVFYSLAGVNHALQTHRNRLENIAMGSDLLAAAILLVVCIHAAWSYIV